MNGGAKRGAKKGANRGGRVRFYSAAEIAFIVKCAGQGLSAREAALRLNAKFGNGRARPSLIRIASLNGAPFGYTKVHPTSQPRPSWCADVPPPPRVDAPLRAAFWFRRDAFTDLVRREDEPAVLGPRGQFGVGCKWLHGDPCTEEWQQCGQRRARGSSYCAYHRARTVRPRLVPPVPEEKAKGPTP